MSSARPARRRLARDRSAWSVAAGTALRLVVYITLAVALDACFVKAPDGALGSRCDAHTSCVSVSCQQGVCCNTICAGACQACTSALTGAADGICSPVKVGLDPRGDCADASACDGAGGCRPLIGGVCESDDACATGHCRDGVCCAEACDDLCFGCAQARTGVADGTCRLALAGTARGGECEGAAACDGNGACFAKGTAAACGADYECLSGACRDGVCCADACGGVCLSCSMRTTGVADGVCAPVIDLTDPLDQCAGGTACDGSGACYARGVGASCLSDGACASGYCRDGVCCAVACDGLCEACNAAVSGADGTCGLLASGQETADECSGAPVCDGAGGCVLTDELSTCSVNGQCASSVCCGGHCRGNWVSIGPSLAADTPRAVYAESATSVYVGGAGGLALRFDGDRWLPVDAPGLAGATINAIDGEAGVVAMVGTSGLIVLFDGATWTALPPPAATTLTTVAVVSGARVFAAGNSSIYLWDGSTWSAIADSVDDWRAMWRRGPDVFAGSASGAFVTIQGGALGRYAWPGGRPESPASVDVLAGAALPGGEHLVVTSGIVARTNGVTHTTELDNGAFVGVATSGAVRFAIAANGTFWRYEGTWTSRATGVANAVAVTASDACTAFALRGQDVAKY